MTDSFDQYAHEYDAALAQGIAVSGEDKEFFARGRAECVTGWLRRSGDQPRTILDFGCGTGDTSPILLELTRAHKVIGVDTSQDSLRLARERHTDPRLQFVHWQEYAPDGTVDLAFCNGVFHHIPPPERRQALQYIRSALQPMGLLALWENNPWNPGTRYVMSRIPFDRDAQLISKPSACRLLSQNGFDVLRYDFLFIFPKPLGWCRGVERYLTQVPLGAQYGVFGRSNRKPQEGVVRTVAP